MVLRHIVHVNFQRPYILFVEMFGLYWLIASGQIFHVPIDVGLFIVSVLREECWSPTMNMDLSISFSVTGFYLCDWKLIVFGKMIPLSLYSGQSPIIDTFSFDECKQSVFFPFTFKHIHAFIFSDFFQAP